MHASRVGRTSIGRCWRTHRQQVDGTVIASAPTTARACDVNTCPGARSSRYALKGRAASRAGTRRAVATSSPGVMDGEDDLREQCAPLVPALPHPCSKEL